MILIPIYKFFEDEEQQHVITKLKEADVNLAKVDFLIQETDDIWIRDNAFIGSIMRPLQPCTLMRLPFCRHKIFHMIWFFQY